MSNIFRGKSFSTVQNIIIITFIGLLVFSFAFKYFDQPIIAFNVGLIINSIIASLFFIFNYRYYFDDEKIEIRYSILKNKNRTVYYKNISKIIYENLSPLSGTGKNLIIHYKNGQRDEKITLPVMNININRPQLINLLLFIKNNNLKLILNTREKDIKRIIEL
jgi:hypothetical protein